MMREASTTQTALALSLGELREVAAATELTLLDKSGRIRFKHIGEGAYEETEAIIQALMAEPDPVE